MKKVLSESLNNFRSSSPFGSKETEIGISTLGRKGIDVQMAPASNLAGEHLATPPRAENRTRLARNPLPPDIGHHIEPGISHTPSDKLFQVLSQRRQLIRQQQY